MYNSLAEFVPQKKFLLGVDSDGTVFDTMGIKHKKSFIPAMAQIWNLQEIAQTCSEVEQKINLYSIHRGINRFPGLALTLEQLKQQTGKAYIPNVAPLNAFCNSGLPLSNAGLREFNKGANPFLEEVLQWSELCDLLFEQHTKEIAPFQGVKPAFEAAFPHCDIVIISAASGKGLEQDFGKNGLTQYLAAVAGQEYGTKQTQLAQIAHLYPQGHVLMMGDALGDLEAARQNHALFYPVIPAQEENSWMDFESKVLSDFISGSYNQQDYVDTLKLVLSV